MSEEIPCDLCPVGAGRFIARHRFVEKQGELIAHKEGNLCDRCLDEEIRSWAVYEPKREPPVIVQPTIYTPSMGPSGWSYPMRGGL